MDPSPQASEQILSDDIPVTMPELPTYLHVNTAQQFKALGDSLRWRILSFIQHQPATAKQIATRLKSTPGTVGHHLQVLEAAGLVQVVARRLTHGIIARYYTRTARIFMFDFPPEISNGAEFLLDFLTHARDDLAEAIAAYGVDTNLAMGNPRNRISLERARTYARRLKELADEFAGEPIDPEGQVYALCITLFQSPPYQQVYHSTPADPLPPTDET